MSTQGITYQPEDSPSHEERNIIDTSLPVTYKQ
jgi:hypothetical protein